MDVAGMTKHCGLSQQIITSSLLPHFPFLIVGASPQNGHGLRSNVFMFILIFGQLFVVYFAQLLGELLGELVLGHDFVNR